MVSSLIYFQVIYFFLMHLFDTLMKINLICEGPFKKKCLTEFGIVTQCLAPTKVNEHYVTNVLLKINAKVY
jgi:hypothetical protein